jgi:hypothetical protein
MQQKLELKNLIRLQHKIAVCCYLDVSPFRKLVYFAELQRQTMGQRRTA